MRNVAAQLRVELHELATLFSIDKITCSPENKKANSLSLLDYYPMILSVESQYHLIDSHHQTD
jgi:hypothetical protein